MEELGQLPMGPTQNPDSSTFKFMSSFVVGALDEKNRGNSKGYNELIGEFNPINNPNLKMSMVSKWLTVLTNHVSLIQPNCSALIDKILELDWVHQDKPFITAFDKFCLNLCSAQPIFLTPLLKALAKGLLKPKGEGDSDVEDEIHLLLKDLLELVPTAGNVLFNTLASVFPHKRQPANIQTTYCRNLIRILSYCPALRNQMLVMIVDKILKIDVEIQVEIDELDDIPSNEDIFPMDLNDSMEEGNNDMDTDNESDLEMQPSHQNVAELVDKLDGMLGVVFEYINAISPVSQEGVTLYRVLLTHFENSLITTFKSRYTQFLMFYLCGQSLTFTDNFLGTLFKLTTNPDIPQVIRISSAAYLGSFIARAKFLDSEYLWAATTMLSDWLVQYLEMAELEGIARLDPIAHAVFYANAQAALYIFCFRWRHFQLNELSSNQDPWHTSVTTLRHIVNSKLNPLKVCSEVVVDQFAMVSNDLNFMYCYPLLESNRKLYLPVALQGHIDSETFFPFDPFKLSKSQHLITPLYQEWQSISQPPEEESNSVMGSMESPMVKPTKTRDGLVKRLHHKLRVEEDDELGIVPSMMAMSLSPTFTPFKPSPR